jgi:hypothetical protein
LAPASVVLQETLRVHGKNLKFSKENIILLPKTTIIIVNYIGQRKIALILRRNPGGRSY